MQAFLQQPTGYLTERNIKQKFEYGEDEWWYVIEKNTAFFAQRTDVEYIFHFGYTVAWFICFE